MGSEKPMDQRGWSECPTCRGSGWVCLIGGGCLMPYEKPKERPAISGICHCPTCAAHFAGVDAAYERGAREERRASGAAGIRMGVADALAVYRAALHAGPAPTPEGKRCGKCAHDYENCGPAKYAPSKCARWTPKTVAKDGGK